MVLILSLALVVSFMYSHSLINFIKGENNEKSVNSGRIDFLHDCAGNGR